MTQIPRLLRDGTIIGMDFGNGKDYTCISYFKTPGRLRLLLRKIKLDRSRWTMKLVKSEVKR